MRLVGRRGLFGLWDWDFRSEASGGPLEGFGPLLGIMSAGDRQQGSATRRPNAQPLRPERGVSTAGRFWTNTSCYLHA